MSNDIESFMRHQAHHQKTPEPTLSYCLWGLSTVGTHLHVTHLSVRGFGNPRNSLCESRGSELSLTFRFVITLIYYSKLPGLLPVLRSAHGMESKIHSPSQSYGRTLRSLGLRRAHRRYRCAGSDLLVFLTG